MEIKLSKLAVRQIFKKIKEFKTCEQVFILKAIAKIYPQIVREEEFIEFSDRNGDFLMLDGCKYIGMVDAVFDNNIEHLKYILNYSSKKEEGC